MDTSASSFVVCFCDKNEGNYDKRAFIRRIVCVVGGLWRHQVIDGIKKRKGVKLDLEMDAADWKEVRALLVPYRRCRRQNTTRESKVKRGVGGDAVLLPSCFLAVLFLVVYFSFSFLVDLFFSRFFAIFALFFLFLFHCVLTAVRAVVVVVLFDRRRRRRGLLTQK